MYNNLNDALRSPQQQQQQQPEILSPAQINTIIVRQFKLHSLTITPKSTKLANEFIKQYLGDIYDAGKFINTRTHVNHCVDLIVSTTLQITKDQHKIHTIDDHIITQTLQIIRAYQSKQSEERNNAPNSRGGDGDQNKSTYHEVELAIKYATLQQIQPIYVLDPYNTTQFKYSVDQDMYIPEPTLSTKTGAVTKYIHSQPRSFSQMFTDRYHHILSRLMRQEKTTAQQHRLISTNNNNSDPAFNLSDTSITTIYQVDSLRGNRGELTVFGYMSEIVGQIYLESPISQVQLDLSHVVLYDVDSPPSKQQRQQFSNRQQEQIITKHSLFSKLFVTGCFVLVTGVMQDNIFIAQRCVLPPHESSKHTISLYPSLSFIYHNIDYISSASQHYNYTTLSKQYDNNDYIAKNKNSGNDTDKRATGDNRNHADAHNNENESIRMYMTNNQVVDVTTFMKNQTLLMESLQDPSCNHQHDQILILGEIYLHDPTTINKLHSLFSVCNTERQPPQFIIFTGNYFSLQFYLQNRYNPTVIKQLFDKLADVIFGYKHLRTKTKFIFCNGTYDFSFGNTVPVPPLQPSFVHKLVKNISHVTFTSNLVNLRYYGRDIKIYRGDIYQTIHRRNTSLFGDISSSDTTSDVSSLHEQDEDGNNDKFVGDVVVKHITSQSTLLTDYSNVIWDYAQPYSLFTLPDILFLVETEKPYIVIKYDSTFCNVGCFTGQWHLVSYRPATGHIEPIVLS